MTFASVQDEMRERFTETLTLTNHIRLQSPDGTTPLDGIQKSMRGLWLVSLYAAFERSAHAIVEAAIREVSSHGSRSIDCNPAIQSIIHFSKLQAVNNCGLPSIFDKSVILFNAAFSSTPLTALDNPLAERMQNVNGSTLTWIAGLFGLSAFELNLSDKGRLESLRERRNAVAHGRESASEVGQRYSLDEMNNMYNAADRVTTEFFLAMREHCTEKLYLRVA